MLAQLGCIWAGAYAKLLQNIEFGFS